MSSPGTSGQAPPACDDVGAVPLWQFACPICGSGLARESLRAICHVCGVGYPCVEEIWRFLPQERLKTYEQFIREYRIVRDDQGWGRLDAGYLLALPSVPEDDPHRKIWQRRDASCRVLLDDIVAPLSARSRRTLRILDLGAGNCWLAYRLTLMGHHVTAVDISLDRMDGLGAHVWYRPELERVHCAPFTVVQAELDRLPLADGSADLAVFNASLHYSIDVRVSLQEAIRVLAPHGTVVIMDSPVYRNAGGGERMVYEREREYERKYGFRSDSVPAENFLTIDRLNSLASDLGFHWRMHSQLGTASRLRARWRRVRGARELAEMPVIAGVRA